MIKRMLCLSISSALLVLTTSIGHAEDLPPALKEKLKAQDQRARQEEQGRLNRAIQLKQQIQKGWTPEQVSRIMGLPEQKRVFTQGNDTVEVWGYDGFEIRIQFRNGLVESSYFSFMK